MKIVHFRRKKSVIFSTNFVIILLTNMYLYKWKKGLNKILLVVSVFSLKSHKLNVSIESWIYSEVKIFTVIIIIISNFYFSFNLTTNENRGVLLLNTAIDNDLLMLEKQKNQFISTNAFCAISYIFCCRISLSYCWVSSLSISLWLFLACLFIYFLYRIKF